MKQQVFNWDRSCGCEGVRERTVKRSSDKHYNFNVPKKKDSAVYFFKGVHAA